MPRLATRKINSSLRSSGSLVVAIASNASINVLGDASTTQYSWGCRAKLTPDNAAATVFFSKASAKYSLQLRIETGGKIRASVYDGVNNPVAQSANTYTDNEWHTFIGVRDGTSLKLYIDGSLAGSTTSTINDCNESSGISMFGNGTKGVFSEGFVTLTAMTATEVMNHEINNTLPASCLAILPCNEGAGSIAYDSSGNANDATITSPTWTRDAPSKTRKTVNNNLVYNGDFEIAPAVNVPQTTPFKWYDGTATGLTSSGVSVAQNRIPGIYYWDQGGSGSIMIDTTEKFNGKNSLKVSTLGTGAYSAAGLGDFNRDDYIEILPNTSYTLTFWMKTNYVSGDSNAGASIAYDIKNAVRTTITYNASTKIKTTTNWTFYTATITTAATARYVTIVPRVDGNTGTGTLIMDAWFADITFRPTTATTRNVPTKLTLSEPSENLLYNSDFESAPTFTAATTTTARWIDGTAGGSLTNTYGWLTSFNNSCSVQFDTTEKFSGTSSMKVSTTGANATAQVISTVLPTSSSTSYIDILPNTQYRITFKMKTNYVSGDSRGAFLRFSTFDSAKTASYGVDSTYIKTTTDWTTYTITYVTSPVAYYGQIKLFVYAQDAPATLLMDAWFDDIQFIKLIPPRKTPDNLLSNGNFEYAPPFTAAQTTTQAFINGTATGSVNYNSPYIWGFSRGNTATAQFDSTVSKFGTNSLKITTGSSTAYGEVNLYGPFVTAVTKNVLIPALPNTAYTISWWMKTEYVSGDSSQGAVVGLIEYNGVPSSTTFNSGAGATIKITTDWTYYSYTVTTQSTTRYLNVQPRIYGHTGTGTLQMNAWFDDITLTTTAPYRNRKSIDNLVTNGDFESVPTFVAAQTTAGAWIDGTAAGTANQAYGWCVATAGLGGSASINYDSTVSHSGTTSLKLSALNTSGTAVAATNLSSSPTAVEANTTLIKVLPSTSYTLTVWAKTNNVGTGGVYADIRQFTGARASSTTTQTNALSGTNDWTQLTLTLTTDSTTRYIGILLRNAQPGTINDAWFDDITLVKN